MLRSMNTVRVVCLIFCAALIFGCGSTDQPVPVDDIHEEPEVSDKTEITEPLPDTEITVPPTDLTLKSVEPSEGKTAGGELVVLKGSGFEQGMDVLFGSLPAPEVSVLSAIVAHVRTPAHKPGPVNVSILKENGDSLVLQDAFLFRDMLLVKSIEPNEGPVQGGTPVTLRGDGFTNGTKVLIGGRLAIGIQVIDRTTILAVTPPGKHGKSQILISTNWTNAELKKGFTYTQAPELTTIDPVSAAIDTPTVITLTGRGLKDSTVVTVGGKDAPRIDGDGDSWLSVQAQSSQSGPADIWIGNDDGEALLASAFTFYSLTGSNGLEILNVFPSEGPEKGGEILQVTAYNLQPFGNKVFIGGKLAPFKELHLDENRITVFSPPGQGVQDITLENEIGSDTLNSAFNYVLKPKLTKISPTEGPLSGGQQMTIVGSNFNEMSEVFVGALPATVLQSTPNSLTIKTPPGSPGAADIKVVGSGGHAILEDAYNYMPANGPQIYAITPNYGAIAGNTLIHLYGAGFKGNGTVRFGNNNSNNVIRESSTEFTARAPKADAAGVVDVALILAGTELLLTDVYSYFDPYSPYGGSWGPPIDGTVNITVLDIYETSPIENAFVMLGSDPATPYQGLTDDRGQITFSAPDISGPQMVTAAKLQYTAFSVVQYDTENVTVHLIPYNPPSPGGGGGGEGLPFGHLTGSIHGLGKYVVLPPVGCASLAEKGMIGGGASSQCKPCQSDEECVADGNICVNVANEGLHCVQPCGSTADCGENYLCGGVGNSQTGCLPHPGEKAAYCQTTSYNLWEAPPTPHPFLGPEDDGTRAWADENNDYWMKTRLGELAVICVGGVIRDPKDKVGSFIPMVMGIKRHVEPIPGEELPNNDITLNIPLNHIVPLRLDGAPLSHTNGVTGIEEPTLTTLEAALDFGAEGYWQVAYYTEMAQDNFALTAQPSTLSGDLEGASYAFKALVSAGLTAESGTQANKIKVLDTDRMFAFENGNWSVIKSGIPKDVHALWGSSKSNIWAVGADGLIAHGKVGSWFPQFSPTNSHLHAVWGTAANEVCAVGDNGIAVRFNGATWTLDETGVSNPLYDIWGTAPDNLFAVGQGVALHRDTQGWNVIEGHPGGSLFGVWGPNPTELWAVGEKGRFHTYDGANWSSQTIANSAITLRAISGENDSVWVVGDLGTVLQWTPDSGWEQLDVPTKENLHAVSVHESGEVFAAGARGTLLHFDGLGWTVTNAPKYGGDLRAIWTQNTGEITSIAAGTQVVSLGPMLSFPEIGDPIMVGPGNVSTFSYHLNWTVKPSVLPTFNFVEMLWNGSFPVWWNVIEAETMDITFPNLLAIKGISPFPNMGTVNLVVNRVLKPGVSVDNFDFWDTYNRSGWKSWAKDQVSFTPPN